MDGPRNPVGCAIHRFPRLHRFYFFLRTTEPPGDDRITLVAQQEHRWTVVNAHLHFRPEHPDFRFLFQRPRYPFRFCVDTYGGPGWEPAKARAHWFSLTSELGRNYLPWVP